MKWNIGTKIGGGYALALIALISIGIVSYYSTQGLIESMALRRHSYEVLGSLSHLSSILKDAETGQRGFLLTGEPRYLEPYTTAIAQAKQMIDAVRDLTKDNPSQQHHLDELTEFKDAKFAELKQTIDLRRDPTQGFESAKKVMLTDLGKNLMDQIRQTIAEMEADELALLQKRSDDAQRSADQTTKTIIIATFASIVFLSLVSIAITQNISAPLNQISQVAEQIAAGDLNVVVATGGRDDEVGRLAKTFAKMTKSLQEMAGVAKLIADNDLRVQVRPQSSSDVLGNAFSTMVINLRRTMSELADGVNVLATSASEILAATTEVAASAVQTGSAIVETTSTVEEVKQTSQVSNQKAKYVSETAQKATHVAQTGRKSVDASIEGMRRIQAQMESIAESVVKLSEQSQAIGEIIASVNDLAEQSNLLAVNAAIEAAKAGEHGKGFSVVAQEVKSLAEQSKQATAQVRMILSDIQKATTAAVLATEQGSKAVETGLKQSTEAGDSIRQLADIITEAAQAASQIAASSQQQLVGSDQVAMAMESIKQASAQNVAGTKQSETAAHNLHELGQKLKTLVQQYKN